MLPGSSEGRQIANPEDPVEWAKDLADLLLRIHDVRPVADECDKDIYDGNELGLYFMTGHWPEKMSGHPLSDTIYGAIRDLSSGIHKVPPVFLHMDYWPGNVLWLDGQCVGGARLGRGGLRRPRVGRRVLQDEHVP